MKTIYVLLHDDYADWEPASALAELRRSFGFSVQSMGLTTAPIVSMGGLRIIPDIALSHFVPESAAILILPGGDAWMEGEVVEVSDAINAMVAVGQPVAAICAATLALAHAGQLNDRGQRVMAEDSSRNMFANIEARACIADPTQSVTAS